MYFHSFAGIRLWKLTSGSKLKTNLHAIVFLFYFISIIYMYMVLTSFAIIVCKCHPFETCMAVYYHSQTF